MAVRPHPKPPKAFRRTFIRQWRKHRGLTLERLADRIDMVPSHLSMLERGERGYVQETLEAIANALQTDAASLLMRNPSDQDAPWNLIETLSPADQSRAVEYIQALKIVESARKTGTGS